MKLDSAGNLLWSRQFGDNNNGGGREEFLNVDYDASSDTVLLTGHWSGGDFSLGLSTYPDEDEGYFVARFAPDGTVLDENFRFTEIGPIAVSSSGNFGMFGFYGVGDETLFLAGTGTPTTDATGAFFGLFDGNLDLVNVQMGSGTFFSQKYDVAAAPDGTYYAITESGSDVPGGPSISSGNYLAHYSAAGNYMSHREFLGNANPQAVTANIDSDAIVVGNFTMGADVGTGPISDGQGFFVAHYDTSLSPNWVELGTTTTSATLNLDDVSADGQGRTVAIAGENAGNSAPDIGLGPAAGNGSALDIYIATLAE